jgi:hypothetical protein
MKKDVTVVGVGTRRTGKSKETGRPYDFVPVAITYEDPSMNGVRAETVNVPGAMYDERPIYTGEFLTVFMHMQNFRTVIDGILD